MERGPETKKFDNHYYKLKKFKYSYVSMSEEVGAVDLKLYLQFSKVKTGFFWRPVNALFLFKISNMIYLA